MGASIDSTTCNPGFQDWVRSCLAKAPYWTMDQADRAAHRKGRKRRCKMYVYPCRHCGGFHLTTRLWQ